MKLGVCFQILKDCNMDCAYCYGKYNGMSGVMLSIKDWIRIAKKFKDYAIANGYESLKITISGGEPLLYKDIETLSYMLMDDYELNLITNGTFLDEVSDLFLSRFKQITVSIDEFTNTGILGRITNSSKLLKQCERIKKLTKLKINTVITSENYFHEMYQVIDNFVKPNRWKIFKMMHIKGENDSASKYVPNDSQFNYFTEHNKSKVAEIVNTNEVINNYITITPTGQLVYYNHEEGKRLYTEPVLNDITIEKLLEISGLKGERK